MATRVGQVNEATRRVETRTVRRVKTTEIPWTAGPTTRWERIKRVAVG